MHIHATVYQCTLNVLVPFIQWSTRWLCWHCFLSVHFFSHPTLSLSHREEACAVEAWYMPECLYWHWENDDQNVFMGWYSMVYYLSNTVCVFYFPRSWWGWLAGVFIKSLNLCDVDMKFQSRWLFFFFFSSSFLFVVGLYISPDLYSVVFTVTATCGAPSFLLGHNQPRGMLLENTWVEMQSTTFSLFFVLFFVLTQLIVVKVQSSTKGLTEHFNPGQCWSHGGGVTC